MEHFLLQLGKPLSGTRGKEQGLGIAPPQIFEHLGRSGVNLVETEENLVMIGFVFLERLLDRFHLMVLGRGSRVRNMKQQIRRESLGQRGMEARHEFMR